MDEHEVCGQVSSPSSGREGRPSGRLSAGGAQQRRDLVHGGGVLVGALRQPFERAPIVGVGGVRTRARREQGADGGDIASAHRVPSGVSPSSPRGRSSVAPGPHSSTSRMSSGSPVSTAHSSGVSPSEPTVSMDAPAAASSRTATAAPRWTGSRSDPSPVRRFPSDHRCCARPGCRSAAAASARSPPATASRSCRNSPSRYTPARSTCRHVPCPSPRSPRRGAHRRTTASSFSRSAPARYSPTRTEESHVRR